MDINSRIAAARARFVDADPLNVEEYDAAYDELRRLVKERNDMLEGIIDNPSSVSHGWPRNHRLTMGQ